MRPYIPMIDYTQVLEAGTTQTATYSSAWLDLGNGFEVSGPGEITLGVVTISAIDLTSGNETYSFKLQDAAPDASGNVDASTAADIGVGISATANGNIVVKGILMRRFVRLVMTAGGTTPSVTYNANLGR